MTGLVAFLAARVDEDEAAAKDERIYFGPHPETIGEFEGWLVIQEERMLRDVAAKRAILDRHSPHETAFAGLACDWCSEDVDDRPQLAKVRWPCPDVRSLAAVYDGHPDYDEAWRPS